MPDPTHPEHNSLHARLDKLDAKLTAMSAETHSDHWRTHQLETQMVRVRRVLWGDDEHGLESDGGLVGRSRQARRDTRILGFLIVFVMPIAMLFLDRLVS